MGGNAQDLEDEANADIVDTLIDDAFGEHLLASQALQADLHVTVSIVCSSIQLLPVNLLPAQALLTMRTPH